MRRANAELEGVAGCSSGPREPSRVVRVLVEAENEAEAEKLCDRIAALVNQELG